MRHFSQQPAETILDVAFAFEVGIYDCYYAGGKEHSKAYEGGSGRAGGVPPMLPGVASGPVTAEGPV